MPGETRALAEWISQATFAQIPPANRSVLVQSLLDTLGCAIAGAHQPWTRLVSNWIVEQQGRPDASVWQRGVSVPTANAALPNGLAVHALCFDDTHPTKVHPGAVVTAAAAAVSERLTAGGQRVDGATFSTALFAGYETMIRVAHALGPSAVKMRGWHISAVAGPLGAAAAAARLYGLDAATTASALGLAGTQSSGLYAFTADGSDSERFHLGHAARSGVAAAELAAAGFRGPTQVLEARDGGLCRTFSDDGDAKRAAEDLGIRFYSHEMSYKPYPTCASLVATVDAVRALKAEHGLGADDVQSAEVGLSRVIDLQCGWEYRPLGTLQAQLSLQYCVAAALRHDVVSVAHFGEADLAAPATLALAAKVRSFIDPEVDRIYPARMASLVVLNLADGRRVSARVDAPKGSEFNPMTFEELEVKFHSQADPYVGPQAARAMVASVRDLERLDDVTAFLRPMGEAAPEPALAHS